MDLSRITSLPEKASARGFACHTHVSRDRPFQVKVDLALVFLSTLLGRRHLSLLRLGERRIEM